MTRLENIDFIKGLATLSVILLHTLPEKVLMDSLAVYHIWQAVPTFMFISFFLSFKGLSMKDNILRGYFTKERIKGLFKKLWLPLLSLSILQTILYLVFGNVSQALRSFLCLSNGSGSYYIWCYMQIWFLIPFLYLILNKFGVIYGGLYGAN